MLILPLCILMMLKPYKYQMFVHVRCKNVPPNLLMNLFQLKYMFQVGVPYIINLFYENQKLYISLGTDSTVY